jgi:hypothetical protein
VCDPDRQTEGWKAQTSSPGLAPRAVVVADPARGLLALLIEEHRCLGG